jgi:nitrile hydratase
VSDHDHDAHAPLPTDDRATYFIKRTQALAEVLIEKGVLDRAELAAAIADLEARTPKDGARLIARAWVDPAFKARLLADPAGAAAELGVDVTGLARLVVVENTEDVHHLVVCTLCSCYPSFLLGQPPDWYKSLNYRARAVNDPRGVMAEFGLRLPDDVEVRVLDSTADMRYLVLPRRPAGTDGWNEEELAALVTRDSMIGVVDPLPATGGTEARVSLPRRPRRRRRAPASSAANS